MHFVDYTNPKKNVKIADVQRLIHISHLNSKKLDLLCGWLTRKIENIKPLEVGTRVLGVSLFLGLKTLGYWLNGLINFVALEC